MTTPTDDPATGSSRRQFLRRGGLGLAALYVSLQEIQQAVADELPSKATGARSFGGLRAGYSLADGLTYLNHASIGTMPRAIQQAQRRYLELCESNPWLHMWGTAWKGPRDEVRGRLADWLSVDADELAFTHNTTECFNLLAQGLPLGDGDEVLFTSLNHSGASVCWRHAAERRGFTVRELPFPVADTAGLSTEDVVRLHVDAVREKTRVLVLPHVDNLVGLHHPVQEIARQARSRGVRWVVVDAAQTIGMLPVDVGALGVDALATSPHKWLQAPKGTGLAYLSKSVQEDLEPMWVTWGQRIWQGSARAFEDYGTRNLAEVLTLGDALTFQQNLGAAALEEHHRRLWQHAKARVDAEPKLTWNSPRDWKLSAALYSVGFTGKPADEVFTQLFEEKGFVFRPFTVQGLNAVRLSPNALNDERELDAFFDALLALL